MHSETAYIALGSNVGDRRAMIESAMAMLEATPEISVLAASRIIETEPVGPVEQGCYLNTAAKISTTLPPRGLLDVMLSIERAHGRDRSAEQRWGPRTLDLDLLLYGDSIIDEPGLTIPHPRLHERLFVLTPLAEIASDVVHPTMRVTMIELLRRC